MEQYRERQGGFKQNGGGWWEAFTEAAEIRAERGRDPFPILDDI